MPDKAFTVITLASYWDCSVDEVYHLLRSRRLKGFKLGKAWRISPDAVREYEESFHDIPTTVRRYAIT